MIKLNEAIIVEGKYDKIKLSSIVDAVIIETEGFGIFKDKDKQKLIRRLAETKGLIVLTDSDSAGFTIRNFLGSIVPKDRVVNVYIPDIYGKEKRKDSPSKEGKLGVEGVSVQTIENALTQAGIGFIKGKNCQKKEITITDFYEDKLTGTADSKTNRKKLLSFLDLPERLTTKGMIEIFNSFMTYDEYKNCVKQCLEEEE
ncbi:MAG: DUF4093 domain-containing protein [Ruminococcus sp.]|nr:DUF4093 domain-containing protein [Candidatus Copronaster equi]